MDSTSDVPATQRVLETSELLHEILAYLPPRKINVVQSVYKTWQASIMQSKEIQKMLFREPVSTALFSRTAG